MEPWTQKAHHVDSTKDPPRRNIAKNLKTVERYHPEYQQQNYDYQHEQSVCALQEQASGGARNTGLSKKMDGIWNRYNLKITGRIYTFGILKCSEEFKVLDLS